SGRRRHTRCYRDWSSDVCSSDLKEADASATSPGKDVIRELLARHAPCVVLIDELVAYVRQFPEGQTLSGGGYDSNLSFVQALTEIGRAPCRAEVEVSGGRSTFEI